MSTDTYSGNPVSPFADDDPDKTLRAATESMVIHSRGDSMWDVYSGTKAVGYTVFGFNGLTKWGCECPDHIHRGSICKHIRRVQMALGLRDIPETPGHSKPDVVAMKEARARVAARRAARKAEREARWQEHRSGDTQVATA